MRKGLLRIACVIFLYLVFNSFISVNKSVKGLVSNTIEQVIPPEFAIDSNAWVDSVFNTFSLEDKISQLFMVAVNQPGAKVSFSEVQDIIKDYNIGGVIFFKGTPVNQAIHTNKLQSLAKTPLLVAIDGEWGLGMRLDSTISYPKQMMLGAVADDKLIYEMGADIGRQMKRMGIHMNFAPVVDVNNNPDNPVINFRSFGENRELVARKSICYMIGMQDQHLLTTAKHFPGHGDTDVDSHKALPIVNHHWERLDSIELYPFKALINNGLSGVMVAHMNVTALDNTPNLATSLSSKVVTDLLQDKLGFKGLIVTDAMNMGGVTNHYKPSEADLLAFKAGNDIILMPDDVESSIKLFVHEVKRGNISEDEINRRCRKILAAKYWVGLNNYEPVTIQNLIEDINTVESNLLNQRLIENALTVVKNENDLLPLQKLDTLKIASLNIGYDRKSTFQEYLEKYTEVENFNLHKNHTVSNAEVIVDMVSDYNLIIIGVENTSMYPTKKYGITQQTIDLIEYLAKEHTVVLDLFSNPYVIDRFKDIADIEALIVSYTDNYLSQKFSAQLIFGGIPAKGQLPVSTRFFTQGTSNTFCNTDRLKYSIPEDVNMNSRVLARIDSVAENAILNGATPGCQVLVAKNNAVIFQKSYGYHTYRNKTAVENNHLYDLASITKVAATLPLIMQFTDEKRLDVGKTLAAYLEDLDTTNKSDIVISDILFHQACLMPWIPFYISTLENIYPSEDFSSKTLSDKYPYQVGYHYYVNKHLKYKDNYFSSYPVNGANIEVASGMYASNAIVDTIFKRIYNSDLRDRDGYKYSDLGFYLLYKTFEQMTDSAFEDMVQQRLYNKLGATTLGYLPINKFDKSRIVPTENDVVFRRQLLHGYVHDPGAAMMGGVSGHAGLFGSANDLAKLMQMYLNGGTYGGDNFIETSTLVDFSKCYDCDNNRRGMGFDKPELNENYPSPVCDMASPSSFGHTGFTGTIAWVDPEYDLVYIFLSNRVHPDAMNTKLIELNVRTDIQEIIYESIVNEQF